MSNKKEEKIEQEKNHDDNPQDQKEIIHPEKDLPTINAESQLSNLVSEMPEVVPEAVQSAQEEIQQSQNPQYSHLTDRYGRTFDSNIHLVDEQGKPKLTRDNNIRIRQGRKPSNKLNIPAEQQQQYIDEQRNRRYFAEVTANIFIQSGVAVFGDEWQPEKTKEFDEQNNLVNVTDDYYKVTGIKEPPPWAVLLIAYGSYGLRRFSRPKTKTTLQKFGGWCKQTTGKFFTWIKRNKKKGEKNARPNSGNNTDGKDHVSVQISDEIQNEGNPGFSA